MWCKWLGLADVDGEIRSRWERKLRRFREEDAMNEKQSKTDGFFTMREERRERAEDRKQRSRSSGFWERGEATQAAITYTTTAATRGKQAVRNWILEPWTHGWTRFRLGPELHFCLMGAGGHGLDFSFRASQTAAHTRTKAVQ